MKLILSILLLLPSLAIAQVAPGDVITFGKGSADGHYEYITGRPLKKISTLEGVAGTIVSVNKALTEREGNGDWFNIRIMDGKKRIFLYANIDSAISAKEVAFINGDDPANFQGQRPDHNIIQTSEGDGPSDLQSLVNAIDRGMTLKFGRGTKPNGDFAYIGTSDASWLTIMASSNAGVFHDPMPAKFSGLTAKVKKVRKFGNQRVGYKKMAVIGVGNIVNYAVDLYGAITSGEVVAVNGKPITRSGQWASGVSTSQATAAAPAKDKAQKLLDWKKALDAGAITRHEYDSIKAEIMHD